jgi:hypothetical protein
MHFLHSDQNIPKGLRRLHDLLAGEDLTQTKAILDALPIVLDLPGEVVHNRGRQVLVGMPRSGALNGPKD